MKIKPGDCVRVPDGRVGRVRDTAPTGFRIRLRRKTSQTHQFLEFSEGQLEKIPCPKGWMSPEGYNRYLKITLEKMRQRLKEKND